MIEPSFTQSRARAGTAHAVHTWHSRRACVDPRSWLCRTSLVALPFNVGLDGCTHNLAPHSRTIARVLSDGVRGHARRSQCAVRDLVGRKQQLCPVQLLWTSDSGRYQPWATNSWNTDLGCDGIDGRLHLSSSMPLNKRDGATPTRSKQQRAQRAHGGTKAEHQSRE